MEGSRAVLGDLETVAPVTTSGSVCVRADEIGEKGVRTVFCQERGKFCPLRLNLVPSRDRIG